MWSRFFVFGVLVHAAVIAFPAMAVEFPGPNPGKSIARLDDDCLVMENAALSVTWNLAGGLRLREVVDRLSGGTTRAGGGEAVVLSLADGKSLTASDLRPSGKPSLERIEARADAVRIRDRCPGFRATVPLVAADDGIAVLWQATLRDGSNYVTQQVTLSAKAGDVPLEQVTVLQTSVPNAHVAGVVDGSPVVTDEFFFACEHPMASGRVQDDQVVCSARCYRPLAAGQSWSRTSVIGVVPRGQMRRGFLYYVDRERVRPYNLFLHYNSWWDIAWPDRKMNEELCLEVIETFGRELIEKRNTRFDSFCFDDGWDDNKTLWRFHAGFPNGFTPHKAAAAKYDSSLGVWLSPWGGYAQAKKERMQYGQTQGFETNGRGFSLAGPKYYARFRDVCAEMIREYGASFFKFDGIAQGINSPGSGDEFAPDVEALLRLTADLRQIRPDVFISITTGTWPSPYWLWYGDSVWRNGHDWNAHGAGSVRQQWITYRDMTTRKMIAQRGPLYPLNSLMIVAVCYAQLGTATKMSDDTDDLIDEIRMAFGGGTQTLELYVTPKMLQPRAWDALAEAANWARENGDVLVDSHFVGGDPGEGQPYGYASWSPRKGILVLRNPGEAAASLTLDVANAFELPASAPRSYRLASPWKEDQERPKITLRAGRTHKFQLEAFEVRVLEATPVE